MACTTSIMEAVPPQTRVIGGTLELSFTLPRARAANRGNPNGRKNKAEKGEGTNRQTTRPRARTPARLGAAEGRGPRQHAADAHTAAAAHAGGGTR